MAKLRQIYMEGPDDNTYDRVYKTFRYEFDSIDDLVSYILNHDINTEIFYELSSNTGSIEFTKTNSFEEAVRLLEYGWNEEFEKIVHLKDDVDRKLLELGENSLLRTKDYVGFSPSIPDYLHGNPQNMHRVILKNNYEIINVYVSLAYSSTTSVSRVYNRGAIIMSIIDVLEKNGYGVNLNVFEICKELSYSKSKELFLAKIKLKDEFDNLSMSRVYFPFCHPSMLRRIMFRLKEVTPLTIREWVFNYGKVMNGEDIKEIMGIKEEDIFFSTPYELGIFGDNIYDDLQNTIESLNLGKYFEHD